MGTFDRIIATMTCPCCKRTYLDEYMQTKDFNRMQLELHQSDDVRTADRRLGLADTRNMRFACHTVCTVCGAEVTLTGVIRDYVFEGVEAESFREHAPGTGADGIVMDLHAIQHPNYAADNGLQIP